MAIKRVALIACSNGYGHVRRLLLLSEALNKLSVKCVLFAPRSSIDRLVKTENIIPPEMVNFDSKTTLSNWINGSAVDWYKYLPDLKEFDVVVCDNLIEILNIRPDAWISGSFLWHESLENFPINLKIQSEQLLQCTNPRIISSKKFISKKLINKKNLYQVGLFSNRKEIPLNHNNKSDFLISCGRGGLIEDETKRFVKKLSQDKIIPSKNVWVEPSIMPNNPPLWMKEATFNSKMYDNTIASIIRPGIGTITNSIASGAKIFTFQEPENKEMEENGKIIDKSNYGVSTSSIRIAWNKAIKYAADDKAQEKYFNEIGSINLNGAKEAASIIFMNSLC